MKEKLFIKRLFSICVIIGMGLAIWSCQEDELDPNRPDNRLLDRDKVYVLHVNPLTNEAYTSEELDTLEYDPAVEEFYYENTRIELFVWTQQKPKQVEVYEDGNDEPLTIIYNAVREDHPEFGSYKDGYGYVSKWVTKCKSLEIEVGASRKFNFKVIYHDIGIDDFTEPSLKETSFILNCIEQPAISGGAQGILAGHWSFNSDNLLKANVGNDLQLDGAAAHSAASGVVDGDGGAYLDAGTWYNVVNHGLQPDDGVDRVNEFSMVWDVKVASADLGKYIPLLQYLPDNSADGSLYINPSGGFWFNGGPSDYAGTIKGDTWHRIALSVNQPTVMLYVDGQEIFVGDIATPDGKFSLDPTKFIILGENSSNDGNGEDNPITISEFYLLREALTGEQMSNIPSVETMAFTDEVDNGIKGWWNFGDASNLLSAAIGEDLQLDGAAAHSATSGVIDGDGAAYLESGTWYNLVNHGLQPGDGVDRVNEFSMIWDVKVASADLGKYICLLQYLTDNSADGAFYINPSGGFWFNGGPSDFAGTIKGDTWHRIALSVSQPTVTVYVDGEEIFVGDIATPDGKFSIDVAKFIILGENSSNDGNGEDNPITISSFILFDNALSSESLSNLPPVNEPVTWWGQL